MPDLLDRAKDLEMLQRDQAVENARARLPAPEPLEVDGVRVCVDCMDPIPPARLAAWPEASLCVECKGAREAHR